jgi:hypothetical protein
VVLEESASVGSELPSPVHAAKTSRIVVRIAVRIRSCVLRSLMDAKLITTMSVVQIALTRSVRLP